MPDFRTIEVSDPRFERDHLRQITVKSPALGHRADITIFEPPQAAGRGSAPLVVLLHGVYSSHWAWTLKGGLHRTAMELIEQGRIHPFVIAMPSDGLWGDGSGYLPHERSNYEQWIVEDVPECVDEVVLEVNANDRFFLGGLSMGGYGALRLGAKYGDRIKAVSAHSAITQLRQLAQFVEEPLGRFGVDPDSEEADVLYWMRENRDSLPAIRFDCGQDDLLIDENRRLHDDLEAEEIPHLYEEFDGDHSWDYWQQHIVDTLLFFDSILKS
ncbi:MAG: alpha/beta fold hydrolase [Blastocatellia bacterium]|nr:alpha/beta fold hydrolase [Blastocatellia bacterium]